MEVADSCAFLGCFKRVNEIVLVKENGFLSYIKNYFFVKLFFIHLQRVSMFTLKFLSKFPIRLIEKFGNVFKVLT